MKPVIRLVCSNCLRSAESDPVRSPGLCAACGGSLEIQWGESSDESSTPLSLALTPEETPDWFDLEALAPESETARVPERIGRFQVRERLGGGGFGAVYRAYDPRLDRDVALKVLHEIHPSGRVMERFFREARAAAQLDHPNIVPLHDAGRDAGRCWIAYQYISGPTLARLRDLQGPIEPQAAARIIRALAEALDHAHRRGVVHRDVKPANVIVDPTGQPRLTDFGLARRLDLDATLTVEGAVLGTPVYMSPEQAAGRSHAADARSDVYSLGMLLYELLCGHRLGHLPSDLPTWRVESCRRPPPLSRDHNGRRVPRTLDRICQRALATEPGDRFPDARVLAKALDRWLAGREHRPAVVRLRALTLAAGLGLALIGAPHLRSSRVSGDHAPAPAAPTIRVRSVSGALRSPGGAVFAVQTSRLCHSQGDCPSLRTVPKTSILHFETFEQAQSRGFRRSWICAAPAQDDQDAGNHRKVEIGVRNSE